MKKAILITAILFAAIQISFAQSSKVMAAYNYLDEYKLGKDGEDLVNAKEAIDAACLNETTSIQAKTWYYKGLIYQLLAKDELLSKTDPNFMSEALSAYEKALSLDDKKFRNTDDALLYIKQISGDVFNSGVDAYQKSDFNKAYKDFYAMKDINKTLTKFGIDLVVDTERCLSNAASAAESAGMNKEAIAAYEELIGMNKKAEYYRLAANLYKAEGDKTKAMSLLDQAAELYPDDVNIVIDQLNYYIEDNKLNEAIDKLDKAIALQPENDMLYFVKGNAYDKNGDVELAIVEYEKAISINPKNDKALYNAGAMYFLGANEYIKQMNELNYNETKKYNELDAKRRELYLKAKPYFEKVLELIPDDEASQKALFKINSALKD
ncbi:MAG: tetratricopeptide repeat protein [Chitinophagales bacterium]|nr:tetratricopeptide repeat protein [Chitinophagales bacterium]